MRRRPKRNRVRPARHHGPERTFRYIGAEPCYLPSRLRATVPMPLQPGDTFCDTSVNWATKADFELVIPEAGILPEELPTTLEPEALREMGWKEAKAYAFDHYGIRARGWNELLREYAQLRG